MEASEKRRPFYFKLPAELDRQLRELARRKERTVTGQIRHLIREAVEREQGQPATSRADLS